MQIGSGRWSMMPPVVKNLLIINGLLFLATFTLGSSQGIDLYKLLGLHYFESELFSPYQFVTYMFMHGDISHIFFNMFAVWMFGSAIENAWGSKRFLIYYLLTGFGAAFLHYLIIYIDIAPVIAQMEAIIEAPSAASIQVFIQEHRFMVDDWKYPEITEQLRKFGNTSLQVLESDPTNASALQDASIFFQSYLEHYMNIPNVVGASGSLFGILLAFGMMFPNVRLMMIFLPIPIKAKYFVMAYGAIELVSAFQNNPGDNVAHFAHLGGMLFGFIIIKIWEKSGVNWR